MTARKTAATLVLVPMPVVEAEAWLAAHNLSVTKRRGSTEEVIREVLALDPKMPWWRVTLATRAKGGSASKASVERVRTSMRPARRRAA